MKTHDFIRNTVIVVLLLSAITAKAQTFKMGSSTRSNLELSLTIDKFSFEESKHDGIEGKTIILEGIFLPNRAGMPNLPTVSRYVAIPHGASVNVNVRKQVTEILTDIDLMPAPELPLDDSKTPMRYYRNEEVYGTDAFYPSLPIITSEPMKIRDVDVVLLSVTPFQYNPVSRELVVTKELDLEVSFEGGNGTFGGDPRYRSTAWEHIIRDMVINENMLPEFDYQQFIKEAVQRRDTGCEYLIITPDNPDFIQLADSIKLFRNQQGILTDVVTVTECGGNEDATIRNYIRNAYNTWDIPPSAVLLLGDHSTDGTQGIVSYTMNNHPGGGGYNPYISDNKYADMGNDNIPDIVVGRITGRNFDELYHMINKDLQYERHPSTNGRFYDRPITAMGFQLERWFQLCSEVVNGFWENSLGKHPVRVNAIYEGHPSSQWSTATYTNSVVNFFGPNGLGYIPQTMSHLTEWDGNANDINNAINAGAFILQHRDHGAEELWGEPSYSIGSINRLMNPDLTYVMSNNCLTGRFNFSGQNGCFAEAFHRHQYGALGLIAATQVSYSFLNDVYVWGVYDNLWPDFQPAYGTDHPTDFVLPAYGNVAGKYFLQQSNWIEWGDGREITYYLFHHHGDVYMNLYTEMPQNLDVTMLPVVVEGDTQYQITATENATICITNNGEIIGLATATGEPQMIEIAPQNVGEELLLTITKQNYFRYNKTIRVIPDEGPYLIFNDCEINDNDNNGQLDFNEDASLNISLHNVGFSAIQNIDVTLSSESPYITINSASTNYASINTNEIVNKADAFTISLDANVPDQTKIWFTLTMSDGTHSFTDSFAITANAPSLKITKLSFKDENGNPTDRLYRGESAQMVYTVNNQGHSQSNAIRNQISIDAPFVYFDETSITTEGIAANDSIDVVFIVNVSNDAPNGAILENIMTTASDGYEDAFNAEIPLGYCIEDFEYEELNTLFKWSNNGSYPWVFDTEDPYEGNYCFTSTSDKPSAHSKLFLGVDIEIDDIVSFYYKGSVNDNDIFTFNLDSESFNLSGNEWQYFECPVTTGSHLLKWTFSRKSNADTGSASIDLIQLPPMHTVYDEVEELSENNSCTIVYPNPGNDKLNIITSESSATLLQVFDYQGILIIERDIDSNSVTTIDTGSWASGLYIWKIGTDVGRWIKNNR